MELADVQRLLPVEATKNKLVAREIPELEQSIKEKQKELPVLTDVVNNVRCVGRKSRSNADASLVILPRHWPNSMTSRRN